MYTVKYLELHFKMHCAHILYLPTGKCLLHIQPFMYTIIYTQTTSVYTDLICWTWTFSINITSLKFNQGHFLTSRPLLPTNAQKEPQFTPTSHLKILANFFVCPSTVFFTHKLTFHIMKSAIRLLPTCMHFVYHVCSFTPKTLSWAASYMCSILVNWQIKVLV